MKKNKSYSNLMRAMVCVLLIVCCMMLLVSCGLTDKLKRIGNDVKEGANAITDIFTGSLTTSIMDSPNIRLMSTSLDETSTTALLSGVKLTATVYPETLADEDKLVDWMVYWIDNQTGNPEASASAYVSIETESDGGNIVYVNPLQSFYNSKIGIKVTTRNGGFSAVCTVTYEGRPTSASCSLNGSVLSGFDDYYNGMYNIDFTLDNACHDVADSFYDLVQVQQLNYLGYCDMQEYSMSPSGELTKVGDLVYHSASSFFQGKLPDRDGLYTISEQGVSVTVEDNQVVLDIAPMLSTLFVVEDLVDSEGNKTCFMFEDVSELRFQIHLGIEECLGFFISGKYCTLEGVSLSKSEISF